MESIHPLEYATKLRYKTGDNNFKLALGGFYKYDGTVGIKPAMEISNFGISVPITLATSHTRDLGIQVATGILALVGLIFYKWSDTAEQAGAKHGANNPSKQKMDAEQLNKTHQAHQIQEIKEQNYQKFCEDAALAERNTLEALYQDILAKEAKPRGVSNSLLVFAAYSYDKKVFKNPVQAVWTLVTTFAKNIGKSAGSVSQKSSEASVLIGELKQIIQGEDGLQAVKNLIEALHGSQAETGLFCCTSLIQKQILLSRLIITPAELGTPTVSGSDKDRGILIVHYSNNRLTVSKSDGPTLTLG